VSETARTKDGDFTDLGNSAEERDLGRLDPRYCVFKINNLSCSRKRKLQGSWSPQVILFTRDTITADTVS